MALGTRNDPIPQAIRWVEKDATGKFTHYICYSATDLADIVAKIGVDFDCSTGNLFEFTPTKDTTISFTNVQKGTMITMILHNGGAFNLSWDPNIHFSNGIAPNLTYDGIDVLSFISVDGVVLHGGLSIVDSKSTSS